MRRRHGGTRAAPRVGAIALVAAIAGVAGWLLRPTPSRALTQQEALGQRLYTVSCSSCHGLGADGTADGPSLRGAGPAGVDFVLSTGRMPLGLPEQQPIRQEPAFTPDEISAIVAYVATIAPGGPPIPTVDADAGDLRLGFSLYTGVCSSCHGAGGTGDSIGGGQIAPSLSRSTPVQIAEAIRIGPGAMPRFGEETYSAEDVDAVARYLTYLDEAPNPGGLGLGRYGPVAEGFVAVMFGFGALLLLIRFTGTKT